MEQILEKLFESTPKVRLLRLFTRNPEGEFTFQDIILKCKIKPPSVRKELTKLMKIGLVKRKKIRTRYEIKRKARRKKTPPKITVKFKDAQVYYVNPSFKILPELRELMTKGSVASRAKIVEKMKRLGNVKLGVVAGTVLNSNGHSRTDLLIVGDGIKKGKFDRFLSGLESELGKSLNYTMMDTKEFKYRLDMYDRFLRDILEYPHDKLINKLHV